MTILDTFYIMFKSNADEVIKGNKAIEKSTKDTERALKNTTDQTETLGHRFVKMVDEAASAAGAIAGFEFLKGAVDDANKYNVSLGLLASKINTTTTALKTFAQAAAESGGSIQGGLGDIASLQSRLPYGVQLGDPNAAFRTIRERIKNMSHAGKVATVTDRNGYNITDPGDINRLTNYTDAEYDARYGSAASVSQTSDKQVQKALNTVAAQAHLVGAKDAAATELAGKVDPAYTKTEGYLSKIADAFADNPAAGVAATIGTFSTVGSGIAAFGVKALQGAGALLRGASGLASGATEGAATWDGISGVGAAAGTGVAGAAAVGTAGLAAGGAAGYGLVSLFQKQIEGYMVKALTSDIKPIPMPDHAPLTKALKGVKTGNADIDFWVGQGYSPSQAAAITANMNAESGGKAGAVGDRGHAHGLFQWHNDRRNNILKGTGIDINTASKEDQLKAAAWEMKSGTRPQFDDKKFRAMTDPAQAAAYFTDKFEHPLDTIGESMRRGKAAMQLASQYGGAGGGDTTINIDNIAINTQATDANGIANSLKDAMKSHLSNLADNNEDGIRT